MRDITITTGPARATVTPTLLELAEEGELSPERLGTHRFELGPMMEARDRHQSRSA